MDDKSGRKLSPGSPFTSRSRINSVATSPIFFLARDPQDNLPQPQAEDEGKDHGDFIPLLESVGIMVGESVDQSMTKEEVRDKMDALTQLISRLDDTTALLRDQLHSAKKTLKGQKGEKGTIIRPIIPVLFKYQIIIVVLIQIVSTTILAGYDLRWKGNATFDVTSKVLMVIFQTLNTSHVILATVTLSKKLKQGGMGTIMAQTYMSTVIVFAGFYLSVYRFDHTSWEFASNDDLNQDNAYVQLVRMLYLSVSSATLCGAANIQPKAWYVTIIVCIQSLINFVYFASILAQTIGNYNSYSVSVRHRDSIVASEAMTQRSPPVTSLSSSVRYYGSTD